MDSLINTVMGALETLPTPDNSQPWRYRWNWEATAGLAIYHDGVAAHHPLNYNGMASVFGLGMVIETAKIAAAKCGYKAIVKLKDAQLKKLNQQKVTRVAQIEFQPDTESSSPLYDLLFLRHTNRNPFSAESVDWSRLLLAAKEFETADVGVSFVPEMSRSLKKYLISADYQMWRQPEILRAIIPWIRMSQREINHSTTGLNIFGLGLTAVERSLIRLFRAFPWLLNLSGSLIGRVAARNAVHRQTKESSSFGCIYLKNNHSLSAVVEAGQVALKLWLLLNGMGCGFHPYTLGAMVVLNLRYDNLGGSSSRSMRRLARAGEQVLPREFHFESSSLPVMLFRFGVADPLPAEQRTKKTPIENITLPLKGGDDCRSEMLCEKSSSHFVHGPESNG